MPAGGVAIFCGTTRGAKLGIIGGGEHVLGEQLRKIESCVVTKQLSCSCTIIGDCGRRGRAQGVGGALAL